MLITIFFGLILEIVAGIMLLWSYNLVSKGKKFAGIATTGCIFGIIGSLLLGTSVFSHGGLVIIPTLNWSFLIIYVIVLVLTLAWRKIR